MKVDITVPEIGDGVTHATVGEWIKKKGDRVEEGELVVDIATDKVGIEVPAPKSGTLVETLVSAEEEVEVGSVIGRIEVG
jgi:2-oxoglutarate dehydrogenase E2 component (dihydrolipoamide succinyltransferase)